MCGLKSVTSCPEYVHRFPGYRVLLVVQSLSPCTEETGDGAARIEVERGMGSLPLVW